MNAVINQGVASSGDDIVSQPSTPAPSPQHLGKGKAPARVFQTPVPSPLKPSFLAVVSQPGQPNK
jgi:hypothetical protein